MSCVPSHDSQCVPDVCLTDEMVTLLLLKRVCLCKREQVIWMIRRSVRSGSSFSFSACFVTLAARVHFLSGSSLSASFPVLHLII